MPPVRSTPAFSKRIQRFLHRVRYEWIGGVPRFQESLEHAHQAREGNDWATAAEQFGLAVKARPESAGVRLQWGHALKESGRVQEAEVAYRSAIKLAPKSADPYIHLGHVLKLQGRRPEAAAAYERAVALAPNDMSANSEFAAMALRRGGRSDGQFKPARVRASLTQTLMETQRALDAMASSSIFPVEDWAAFRNAYPVVGPPASNSPAQGQIVIIDGRNTLAASIRASLTGIQAQTRTDWRCHVIVGEDLEAHPVASMGFWDPRVSFHLIDEKGQGLAFLDHVVGAVLVAAGTVMEPCALDWIGFSTRDGVLAVYADHDEHLATWRPASSWRNPALFGAPGAIDLALHPRPPRMAMLAGLRTSELASLLQERNIEEVIRDGLVARIRAGGASHLSLVLSSVQISGETGRRFIPPLLSVEFAASEQRLIVVIPTRDHADMLSACLDSLKRLASRPELMELVVVDNRSVENKTHALFQTLQAAGGVEILTADEPFNWSRFNNLAAQSRDGDILVFANNDIEMRSTGWDDRLRRRLNEPGVGVVGARLLYPDQTLQHAGIVLGAVWGRPVHEGRGSVGSDGGPDGRWRRAREASAVTGAFLAVTRDTFARVGGFEEALAVAYNDVEFCLKVRAAGKTVLYDPEIEAVHYESKTRGMGGDVAHTAWDDAEFGTLHRKWGDFAITDHYVAPAWTFTDEYSFEGLRPVSIHDVIRASNLPRGIDVAPEGE